MLRYIEPGTQVFKFLNHRAEFFWPTLIDILGQKRIYLNSRSNFNDPFDSRPIVVGEISLANAQAYADQMFSNPQAIRRDADQIANILRLRNQGKTQLQAPQVATISKQMRDNVDGFIDECGLSCFSLVANESLLWAHYAAGFSGICIAFKRGPSVSSAFSVCAEVVYVSERPQISIELIFRLVMAMQTGGPTSEIADEIFFRTLFHKSRSWEYEKEARIYGPLLAGQKIAFSPEELAAVVVGPKSSQDLEETVRAVVDRFAPGIKVVRATLSRDGFHIEIPIF